MGPARRKKPQKAVDVDPDESSDGMVANSEFEENDADLAAYLQANTSFLLGMTSTAAFNDSHLSLVIFLLSL